MASLEVGCKHELTYDESTSSIFKVTILSNMHATQSDSEFLHVFTYTSISAAVKKRCERHLGVLVLGGG